MLDRLKALRTRPYLVALLLGIAAQTLFSVHLDRPSRIMFDEVHYVPAAQTLLDLEGPRNVEHPLVGKELIGAGIVLFGDNPIGWRALTSFAGTATVLGAFAFLWLLLGSMRAALVGAVLTALNQSVYVQARTAMLDIFLGAFLLWAMVVMLWAAKGASGQVTRRWVGAGVLLGLAVGTKWAAIPYVALAGCAFLVTRLRDARVARRPLSSAFSGKNQPHWPGLATFPGLMLLGVVSIATYFLTFLPAFFYARDPLTLAGLIPLQQEMYALQTQVLQRHTYQSDWWSWPLMLRPIWYFYEWDEGAQRGVLLIGNPVIMWGGLLAVLACLWAGFREKAHRPLALALLWIASLGIYVVIPKSLGFYYYYHLSAIFLCLALAAAFHHFDRGRGKGREEWFVFAALAMFVYFYPILAASPLQNDQGFTRWMWFASWR
ncbi:phospholipid carrier-dependent glycosyltransferase [Sphingomonas psychrotolerans]|uniref:Polyprenol-phosphate-mannose--protein mannosyltransferase n=1 Tax=Sphingomonas psychrotolerans TaxID=1327635 RepID=A0A2K8MEJ8_9SPHN|nr:phospholipid carrier-dependent glycosyltransferase [Sphingomonas psychrotolerans]ATY32328.1 dolichyl-phosphate-mannose--protein mannosyltransferase [Sphingomonas psychrotolerans]